MPGARLSCTPLRIPRHGASGACRIERMHFECRLNAADHRTAAQPCRRMPGRAVRLGAFGCMPYDNVLRTNVGLVAARAGSTALAAAAIRAGSLAPTGWRHCPRERSGNLAMRGYPGRNRIARVRFRARNWPKPDSVVTAREKKDAAERPEKFRNGRARRHRRGGASRDGGNDGERPGVSGSATGSDLAGGVHSARTRNGASAPGARAPDRIRSRLCLAAPGRRWRSNEFHSIQQRTILVGIIQRMLQSR